MNGRDGGKALCCYLLSENEVSSARVCSSARQFAISNILVLAAKAHCRLNPWHDIMVGSIDLIEISADHADQSL